MIENTKCDERKKKTEKNVTGIEREWRRPRIIGTGLVVLRRDDDLNGRFLAQASQHLCV